MPETASLLWWQHNEQLQRRFDAEHDRLKLLCRRLGWHFFDRLRQNGIRWKAKKLPNGQVLRGASAAELLAAIERAEVARRALRIEREVTRELCEAAGFRMKDPRKGPWWAVHRTSRHVLEAPTAAGLREKLRTFNPEDPLAETIATHALPWLDQEEAELLEAGHG